MTKKVSEAPEIMMAPPRSPDAPYWVTLLRNLFGVFSSHANAINLLYENLEDDVEYLLPHRTYNGNPIYIQTFTPFNGANGTAVAPATAIVNHNISVLNITGFTSLYGYLRFASGNQHHLTGQFYTGASWFHHAVILGNNSFFFQTDFDARTYTCHPILEYQKV